jgi:hypothetical protein
VSSGGIPPNDDPSPEEILKALREAITNNPRLDDMPVEEIARQLVLEGHLEQEPSLTLVEDALDSDKLPPPYFVEDRSEPAKRELERVDERLSRRAQMVVVLAHAPVVRDPSEGALCRRSAATLLSAAAFPHALRPHRIAISPAAAGTAHRAESDVCLLHLFVDNDAQVEEGD